MKATVKVKDMLIFNEMMKDFFLFEKYDILQIVLNEMSDLFPIT
jgi:hypothetical protein